GSGNVHPDQTYDQSRPSPQTATQVLDEVSGELEPHRQSDHVVADAHRGARLRLHGRVGRRRGMGHQRLGVAQVVGDVDDLQRVEQGEALLLAAAAVVVVVAATVTTVVVVLQP